MIGFIAIILFLLFVGHTIVYSLFISIFPILSAQYLSVTRSIFIVLALSFLAATIATRYYDNAFTEFFYTISSIWLGFLFYFILAAILYGLIWTIGHFISPEISVLFIGRILLAAAVLVGIWGIYNANNIIVTRVTVALPNLPAEWKGRKAVFLSDVHLGQINRDGFAEKINKKIEELNPDIVFNGGDLYDGVYGDPYKLIEPLTFKPSLGTFFITGNHEEYGNTAEYEKAIREKGIFILNNEVKTIDGVNIIGVDYNASSKAEDFNKILQSLPIKKGSPSILLKHIPLNLDVAEKYGINLQLSGHTHRAQIWPLNYITRKVYSAYDYGLKFFGKMQVLTSDGVGTWGPPLRVGTHSEIVLIIFK